MVNIKQIIAELATLAPPALQESYDNAGLLCGDPETACTGVICCLDVTEAVIHEAASMGANLVVAHHPLIFKPLKSLVAASFVERTLLLAMQKGIAIYAIHTNYDNVNRGVNFALANALGLRSDTLKILDPKAGNLAKLFTYVPVAYAENVKSSLFASGAGKIGLYDECSFETPGTGSFRPLAGSDPFIGRAGGPREEVNEVKLEVIFPIWLKNNVLRALRSSHPYEEVAYEIMMTVNENQETGSGMVGELEEALQERDFLTQVKRALSTPLIRHSPFTGKPIQKVAICGGAGAFLLKKALQAGADAFLTGDLKYHDFFEPDGKILLADIGHAEGELPAVAQLAGFLQEKFPTFAVLQTKVATNPVQYFAG